MPLLIFNPLQANFPFLYPQKMLKFLTTNVVCKKIEIAYLDYIPYIWLFPSVKWFTKSKKSQKGSQAETNS